jgi:hypothetical protein
MRAADVGSLSAATIKLKFRKGFDAGVRASSKAARGFLPGRSPLCRQHARLHHERHQGRPRGTQTECPVIVTTGAPPAVTRAAPATQCAVAQGGVPDPASAQPAIAKGEVSVTAGWPDSSTRGNGASGVASPPWLHSTVAPSWRMGAAGILPRRPSARRG